MDQLVFYEDITEDPNKVTPAKALAPALLRFPGGTIANYYNWQTGQIEVPLVETSTRYTRVMNDDSLHGTHVPGLSAVSCFYRFHLSHARLQGQPYSVFTTAKTGVASYRSVPHIR